MGQQDKSDSRNDLKIYLIGGAVLIIGALAYVYLSPQFGSRTTKFEDAIRAIEDGELVTATNLLDSLGNADPATKSPERALVEVGLLQRGSKAQESFDRLNEITIPVGPEHNNVRAVWHAYLSRANFMLGEIDLAKEHASQAKVEDPNELAVLRQSKMLAEYIRRQSGDSVFVSDYKPVVDAFCGDCHVTPDPSSFPKDKWPKEVQFGYDFHKLFRRADLNPPEQKDVLNWYQLQAPEELDIYDIIERQHVPMENPSFTRLKPGPESSDKTGTAHLNLIKLYADRDPVLVVCNMRVGDVLTYDPNQPESKPTLLAVLDHPGHAEPCDLNEDGLTDLVIAELGSFPPEDHDRGKVVYLRATKDGKFEQEILLDGVGRVADVQPGDFDGDGDTDLVVAEFGWRTTGRVSLLKNVSDDVTDNVTDDDNVANDADATKELRFESVELDSRHGAIHVPTVDLNNDGHLDFVCLISQAHETVVAFINDGKANFKKRTLYTANDPSYGSSGISLADVDGDGDQDVLYTNGDTFDSRLLKPYHGVQWLENKGDLEFEYHLILNIFGAYSAVASDIDNDGDQDVVAVASLPESKLKPEFIEATDSIVCFVNDGKQNFERRVIESGILHRVVVIAEDFDGDGDDDLATGRFLFRREPPSMPPFDIWLNGSK